eukprot:scaffold15914_cov19-Tisochrysis_lutea.AAC.4
MGCGVCAWVPTSREALPALDAGFALDDEKVVYESGGLEVRVCWCECELERIRRCILAASPRQTLAAGSIPLMVRMVTCVSI